LIETLPTLDEIAGALKWVTSGNTAWKFERKPVHLVVYVAKPAAPPSGSSAAHFGLPDGVLKGALSLMEKMTLGTESLGIVIAPTVVPPHWYTGDLQMINKFTVQGRGEDVSNLFGVDCNI
jgi:hypothetical protein